MASSTSQKAREFYYEKQVFGNFWRCKASNPAWSNLFRKRDTNANFLDRKWEGCARFLPKYHSSNTSWSDQVDSDGLLHGFMDFYLSSSTNLTDLERNINYECILFNRECSCCLFYKNVALCTRLIRLHVFKSVGFHCSWTLDSLQSWPNKINFVSLFHWDGFSWRTVLSEYALTNRCSKILLHKSLEIWNE